MVREMRGWVAMGRKRSGWSRDGDLRWLGWVSGLLLVSFEGDDDGNICTYVIHICFMLIFEGSALIPCCKSKKNIEKYIRLIKS